MRWLALLLVSVLAGCGEDRSSTGTPRTLTAVRSCLEGKGLKVTGGPAELATDDTDAPDRGELITAGAFIAFYSSAKVADDLAGGVRANTKAFNGTVERHDDVTVVYTDMAAKDTISVCLGP